MAAVELLGEGGVEENRASITRPFKRQIGDGLPPVLPRGQFHSPMQKKKFLSARLILRRFRHVQKGQHHIERLPELSSPSSNCRCRRRRACCSALLTMAVPPLGGKSLDTSCALTLSARSELMAVRHSIASLLSRVSTDGPPSHLPFIRVR